MATSGVTTFDPTNLDVIEEAFELAGIEARTGKDFRSAIMSLNLLRQEWSNKGLNLFTVEEVETSVPAGTTTLSLPTDTIDVLEATARFTVGSDELDYKIKRVSMSRWAGLTNKGDTASRPQIFLMERLRTPQVRFWPVPDDAFTLVWWRLRRIEDAGGGVNTIDAPLRWIPAMVSGLSRLICVKRERWENLKAVEMLHAERMQDAQDEDRDRANFFVKPRISRV